MNTHQLTMTQAPGDIPDRFCMPVSLLDVVDGPLITLGIFGLVAAAVAAWIAWSGSEGRAPGFFDWADGGGRWWVVSVLCAVAGPIAIGLATAQC